MKVVKQLQMKQGKSHDELNVSESQWISTGDGFSLYRVDVGSRSGKIA